MSDSSTPDIVVLCGSTGSGSMFGVAFQAVRGSEASLLIWAVIGGLGGGVLAHYTEHLASKDELPRPASS